MGFPRLRKIRDQVSKNMAKQHRAIAVEWTRDAVLNSLDIYSSYLQRNGQEVSLKALNSEQQAEYEQYLDEDTPEAIREPLTNAIRESLCEA